MNAAIPESAWQRLPPHPRLFADAARFAALREQRDPVTLRLVELLRAEAERHLAAPPVVYPTQGIVLWAVREGQGRVLALATMFRLTGERRYFEGARRELLALVARPDWGTHHFLAVGETSLGAGVGLDWLHDELTPGERDEIARAIADRGLRPSLAVPEEPNGWVKGGFNWNQVCHAGLSVGALAIADREPDLTRQIVDRAVANVPAAGAVYAPDGSYPEGPSYWSYGTHFHLFLVEALRGALGTSAGLETLPGFLESAVYRLQVIAPSGGAFNYADYHVEHLNEPVMLWFARELHRPELAATERRALAEAPVGAAPTKSRPYLTRFLPLELLWWNPDLLDAAEGSLPTRWTAGGHLPLAVLRSAWNDPRATYFAIKGGSPDGSHAHMDAGNFVLEADGVRWALDLGTESYDRMRAAGIDLWNYAQGSSRWTVFRNGPEGHNLPRFDGAPQTVTGHAEIRALPPSSAGAVVELSPLYRGQVENVQRRVQLLPDRSVVVADEWTTGARAVRYSFQWLTVATVTAPADDNDAGVLRLAQAGETLELRVESPERFEIEVEDVSQPRAPQDSPNPGLRRIVIRQQTAPHQSGSLTVRAVPGTLLPPP